MKFIDIVNTNSANLNESLESISEFLESLPNTECVEKELIKQIGIFSNGHFTEASADYAIGTLKPAYGTKTIKEVLTEKNVTPKKAKEMIHEAYQKAINFGITKGFTAPSIPVEYNEYDYYVALATMMADFWYTGEQESGNYCMLAYQWMSNPCECHTKVWDYFGLD